MKLPAISKKFIFWSSASFFIASYIFLTLQTVASGSKYALLEKEGKEIVKQNKELSMELMDSTSLSQINEKSERLGFVKPDKTIYIGKTETVAKLP